jgi:hypothetical protein
MVSAEDLVFEPAAANCSENFLSKWCKKKKNGKKKGKDGMSEEKKNCGRAMKSTCVIRSRDH